MSGPILSQYGVVVNEINPEADALLNEMTEHILLGQEDEQRIARELKHLRLALKSYYELMQTAESEAECTLYRLAIEETERGIRSLSEQLFYANIRWVLKLVNGNARLEFMDRFQWAALGLWRAIAKYDPDILVNGQPVRLSTYATYWIRQSMQRGADKEERLIRLPAHANELLKILARSRAAYRQEIGHDPTVQELCDYAFLDYNKILQLLNIAEMPLSLYMPYDNDQANAGEENTLMDTILDEEENVEDVHIRQAHLDLVASSVRDAINRMEQFERYDERRRKIVYPFVTHAQVLRLRYRIGEPPITADQQPCRTLDEVGKLMTPKRTRERCRQLHRRAIQWMLENEPGLRALFIETNTEDD